MNDKRRRALRSVSARLEALDLHEFREKLDAAHSDLEDLRDEEDEARDSLPESLQDGEKGEAMQAAIDNVESAMEEVTNAIDSLEVVECAVSDAVNFLGDAGA